MSSKNKKNFCCKEMESHLLGKEVALRYNERRRSYGIRILDGGTSVQAIYYCPWCGTKLPKDLTDELFDILYDELNLLDGLDDPNLPDEFKTGEWWCKRKL